MERLGKLVVATADLVEAEGRAFRRAAVRLLGAALLFAIATFIIVIGVCFAVAALYMFAAARIGPAGAAAFVAGPVLLVGGLIAWVGHRIND